MKAIVLRKKYPVFIYQGYSYELRKEDLYISFEFKVGEITFRPSVLVKNVSKKDIDRVGDNALKNLVFHLGLAEMPSYWKATASPHIIVEAGDLNKEQIAWFKDLIFKGMGEYFFQNKIDFTKPNFLTVKSLTGPPKSDLGRLPKSDLGSKVLVPVGGGKDAVVTLELLKKAKMPIGPFLLNPKPQQKKILSLAKVQNPIIVERTIDPKLLELNRKGYLNGHTPFSAYLAFLTTLIAVLFDYKYIALSNERSSNEGNVKYLGKIVNHQYSKTFEFEKKFRMYSKKYLAKGIEYFSFLRPLYELQIAKIFSRYPKYFPAFLSCNEAHKTRSGSKKPTGKWCGKCAKCLFVFLILSPFAGQKQTVRIFKKNLLEDKKLKPLLEELTGKKRFKPFECVGTVAESRAAIALQKQKKKDHPMLNAWDSYNALPQPFARLLRSFVDRKREKA